MSHPSNMLLQLPVTWAKRIIRVAKDGLLNACDSFVLRSSWLHSQRVYEDLWYVGRVRGSLAFRRLFEVVQRGHLIRLAGHFSSRPLIMRQRRPTYLSLRSAT